ncbi:MAG: hypothetical protein WC325_04605 [Candidatus Bathyarchaeia archaeon]|jgi:hypothetical protein
MSEERLHKALEEIQRAVATDPVLKKEAREYTVKNGTLTEADLQKCITI